MHGERMRVIDKGLPLILSISLISCSVYQNNDVGKVTGTIGGGVLGSTIGQGTGRVLAIGTGMVSGFIVGDAIGNVMDRPLARNLNSTLYYNQTNESSCWTDGFGTRYLLTPTSDLIAVNDIPSCRQYHLTTIKSCMIQQEDGIACLQPDETWQVLIRTTAPGQGTYRDLVQYNHSLDFLQTTSPARQALASVDALKGYLGICSKSTLFTLIN